MESVLSLSKKEHPAEWWRGVQEAHRSPGGLDAYAPWTRSPVLRLGVGRLSRPLERAQGTARRGPRQGVGGSVGAWPAGPGRAPMSGGHSESPPRQWAGPVAGRPRLGRADPDGPVFERRGVVVGRRGPVVGRRGPVIGRRGPATGRRGLVVGQRGLVTGRRGPVTGRRGTVTGRRGLAIGRHGLVVGRRGPATGRRGLVVRQRGLVVGQRGLVVGRPGHVAGQRGLVIGRPRLVAGSRGLVVGQRGLVAGRRGLVVGWPGLVAGRGGLVVECCDKHLAPSRGPISRARPAASLWHRVERGLGGLIARRRSAVGQAEAGDESRGWVPGHARLGGCSMGEP